MEDEERRLLRERSAEQGRERKFLAASGTLAALALIALLAATYVLIRRQLRATEASRHALTAANTRIGAILETARIRAARKKNNFMPPPHARTAQVWLSKKPCSP